MVIRSELEDFFLIFRTKHDEWLCNYKRKYIYFKDGKFYFIFYFINGTSKAFFPFGLA